MDDVTIEVYVRLPNGQTLAAARRLSFYEVEEAMKPIDFPSYGVRSWFCTPPEEAQSVMNARKRLANQLTQHILDTIGENDTIDGYSKECK